MDGVSASLENTPTWAVSIVCLFIFLISFMIEAGLHYLAKFLRKRRRKSLIRALMKIKTEMMILGFISLLLTISEAPISKICISQAAANSFLPCEDADEDLMEAEAASSANHCQEKGKVPLMSGEGVEQLRIFISMLAVFHVLYCVLTMCLGLAKMRRWKAWEEETRSLQYKIANDPRRFRLTHQTTFGRRHLKLWSDKPFLLWPVCFLRQFSSTASKADYFTLRNGFIMANTAESSNFNFQKFLARAYDADFEQVVDIRFWIWIFFVLFIFFSAHGFYNHYWLPFIPLVIVLLVGTKLHVIITNMCVESYKSNAVVFGAFPVKLSDDLFWFGQPKWLLHLLQLVLIQNSFQLAFFTWTWYEYGLRSCFNEEIEDIVIRITMGILVQFLCGYRTLPLYALVTQMGSRMDKAVFTESVAKGLKCWHYKARKSLSKKRSSLSSGHSSRSRSPISRDTSVADMKDTQAAELERLPPMAVMKSPSTDITEEEQKSSTPNPDTPGPSTSEITNEETDRKIVSRETYEREISFRSSW